MVEDTRKRGIIAVIQARMGSRRLPGKVLMPIVGKPMLWHIVNRLKYSKLIDHIIIATTTKKKDAPIRIMAQKNNFPYYAGSEEDLLDRFYQASKTFRPDGVLRVTADCPLVDPKITDNLIDFFLKNKEKYEYVSNARPESSFPHGLDVEVISFALLKRLWKEVEGQFNREWFTPIIFKNPQRFKIFCMKNNIDLSHIRLTVDYPEDLELVRYIYQNLYSDKACFYLRDIINLLSRDEKREEHQNVSPIFRGK